MKDDTSPATKADIRRIEQLIEKGLTATNERFDQLEKSQRTSFEFLNNTIGEHVDKILLKIQEFGPNVRNHELRISRLELHVGIDN